MQITQEGLDLIKSFEGLRLEAYQDAVGVWTIGYGHTRGVKPGMRITEAEAEDLLRKDVEDFERGVTARVRVPINANEFSALVSFAFNVGLAALARSTALQRLNAGDRMGAAEALTWWNKAGGRVLPGLVRRRNAEKALFLKGPPDARFDPIRTGTEDDSRVTPEENAPVRKNLAKSRTLQGAAATALGGAGAATVGMTRDDAAQAPAEDAQTPAEDAQAPADEAAPPVEADAETPTAGATPDDAPAATAPAADQQTGAETVAPEQSFPGAKYADDGHDWLILGFTALLVIGVIVIVLARIDDWMKQRR